MAVPHGKGHARQIWGKGERSVGLTTEQRGGGGVGVSERTNRKAHRLGRCGDKVGVVGEIAQVDQPERVADVFVVDNKHGATVLDGELVDRDGALLSRARLTIRNEKDTSSVERKRPTHG